MIRITLLIITQIAIIIVGASMPDSLIEYDYIIGVSVGIMCTVAAVQIECEIRKIGREVVRKEFESKSNNTI